MSDAGAQDVLGSRLPPSGERRPEQQAGQADGAPNAPQLTGTPITAPQADGRPLAVEWGWGEPDGEATRPVTLADGLAPWRDLAMALSAPSRRALPRPPGRRRLVQGAAGVAGQDVAGLAGHVRWRVARWERRAFVAALAVFAITRFWRLGEYPIYFFTDEAFEPVAAEQLLRNHFLDPQGHLLPFYFPIANAWAPLVSVYAHVVPLALLGKSVEVARGTAAVCAVLSAAAMGLILKYGFHSRLWWAGPLLLAATPAWFLHSRTTFETVFTVSFYTGFLLCYLLYRLRSPLFLYPAMVAGALTFYTYTNAQAIMGLTAVLLAGVDLRYHLRHWRYLAAGLALALLLAVPFFRFRQLHPTGIMDQLVRVSSYLVQPLPAPEKARRFAAEYAYGLSPQYWFFPNGRDLSRHVMAGYPHLRTEMLPPFLVGLAVCLLRFREPAYRVALVAAVSAPAGAAVALVGITRVLVFVVPAVLLAAIGLSTIADILRPKRVRLAAGAALFAVLAGASLALLYDALTHGPRWYRDYGLYGQQWGAKQVFDLIRQQLNVESQVEIYLTPTWANGTDLFARFFLDWDSADAKRLHMGTFEAFAGERRNLGPHILFVMTPDELARAQSSGKFSLVQVVRTLPYPDGSPGFHFVRLAYSPDFDRLVAAEKEAQRQLVSGQVVLEGEPVAVRHTRMDAGSLQEIVDGEVRSLGRFNGPNPAVLEMRFPRPRPVQQVRLIVSAGNWEVTLHLSAGADDPPQVYTAIARSPAADPTITIPIDRGPPAAGLARLELRLMDQGDEAIIHVRELQFR
jgi:hypothetical protein